MRAIRKVAFSVLLKTSNEKKVLCTTKLKLNLNVVPDGTQALASGNQFL
jgi:hypothetical protein